jgi:hypothetical protein
MNVMEVVEVVDEAAVYGAGKAVGVGLWFSGGGDGDAEREDVGEEGREDGREERHDARGGCHVVI